MSKISTHKKLLFTLFIITAIISVLAFRLGPLNSTGAIPGVAGDPAGGDQNCTSCHAGPAATLQTGWISSNIPAAGYVPFTTYTITATATRPGHTRFGFEISPQ
ncbi:MAG: hypothetical protein ABUL44_02775, partial [Flavobacterium sp.]